jgi:hypothetical protein
MALLLLLCFLLLTTAAVWAQDPNALPDAPSALPAAAAQAGGSSSAPPYTPLTPGQKFEHFARASVNPYFLLGAGAAAGISQAADTNPGYGQGGEGYGKRFGAAIADEASSNFFGTFLYPTIFHQDPRYFRKGPEGGTGGQRLGYAITRVFVTRGDSGKSQFNISRVLGSLSSAALSNVYYSVHEQTGAKTAERFGLNLAGQAGFNVVREFLPNIFHRKGND